jgi:hypothetical protein
MGVHTNTKIRKYENNFENNLDTHFSPFPPLPGFLGSPGFDPTLLGRYGNNGCPCFYLSVSVGWAEILAGIV